MEHLKEILEVEGNRKRIIKDCTVVLDGEVSKKSGMKGLVIKGGFKVVKKLENGRMVEKAVDMLLDEFVDAIDPYYQSYKQEDEASRPAFSNYLSQRESKVTESLLGVTDKRRQRAQNKILIKTYDKLRPVAAANVKDGVPALGRLMEKYIKEQDG